MRIVMISLLLIAVTVPVAAFDDQLIVPGERIGGVRLGMGLSEGIAAAITTFGGGLVRAEDCARKEDQGKIRCTLRTWITDTYASVLGFVGPDGDQKLTAITTLRPEYRTVDGLGRDSTLAQFVAIYGAPAGSGPDMPTGSTAYRLQIEGDSRAYFAWTWWSGVGVLHEKAGSQRVRGVAVTGK